jgi:ankyrin repeat protein
MEKIKFLINKYDKYLIFLSGGVLFSLGLLPKDVLFYVFHILWLLPFAILYVVIVSKKYRFIIISAFLGLIALNGINNYFFYKFVEYKAKTNASQLKIILNENINLCRDKKNNISEDRCINHLTNLVKGFQHKMLYNKSIEVKFTDKNNLKDFYIIKSSSPSVVGTKVEIVIPKIKNKKKQLDLYFKTRIDYQTKELFKTIYRSILFSPLEQLEVLLYTFTEEEKRLYETLKNKKDIFEKNYKKKYNDLIKKYDKLLKTIEENNKKDDIEDAHAIKAEIEKIQKYKLTDDENYKYKGLRKKNFTKENKYTYVPRSNPAWFFLVVILILLFLMKKVVDNIEKLKREKEIERLEKEKEIERLKKEKEMLKEYGLDTDYDNITKLYEAVLKKDFNLLRNIKTEEQDINILKFTALTEHSESEKLEILQILNEMGFEINKKDKEGMTTLMWYAIGNRMDDENSKVISHLIKNGEDINAQNNNGMTALMLCAMKNKKASVKILLDNKADINIKQDLTAKELAATKEIRDMIEAVEKHFPRQLVALLKNFNEAGNPIKDIVHEEGDYYLINEYGGLKNFLEKVRIQWNEIEQELYKLKPSLHKKIKDFLFADKNSIENWCSKSGDNLEIGWSSLDGLEQWCRDGNNPFNFRLPKTYNIDTKDIQLFGDVIKLFKQEIQIRRENDVLEKIFLDKEDELDYEYDFTLIKLGGKQFYTDVEVFQKVLNKIFQQFQDNSDFKKITVEIVEDEKRQYYDLKITQHGSFVNIDALQLLKKVNGGDFSSVKKSLNNLCDWSIESCYNNECFRVNILKSSNINDIEKLDYKAQGFTHVMRFYL